MNRILAEIKTIIDENMKIYLPRVKKKKMEENGAIYYMNGRNGTEFDWYVNEKIPEFMVFYNDKNNLGAVKLILYNSGKVKVYIYGKKGTALVKEITTRVNANSSEILELAVILKIEADEKSIFNANIEKINTDVKMLEEKISEFRNNRKDYI